MQIPKQVRQLDNSKEQLRVIKSELQSVNNELSKALLKKGSVLDSIKELIIENSEIKKDSNIKLRELKVRGMELDNKESGLSMREEDINRNELTSIMKIEDEQKKLDSNKTNYSKRLADLTDKIGQSELKLIEVSESIKTNTKIKKDLTKEVKTLSTENNKLDSKLAKLEINYSEDLVILDNMISKKNQELDSINNQILTEQQKTGSAEKAIAIEHKKLERRKKNLDTIIARFNKTFKKNYPRLELKV